jgi:hypothetical protein
LILTEREITMIEYLNSKAYTVASLREIAERMELNIKGKITKPVLAGIIADAIDAVHADVAETEKVQAFIDEAFPPSIEELDNDYRKQIIRNKVATKHADKLSAEDRMVSRVNGYMRSNGTDKLTKRQQRRIYKKANRAGINPWKLTYNYAF